MVKSRRSRRKSQSKKRKSKSKKSRRVIPKLRKGSLKKYGYAVHDSATARHTALKKALKAYGYSTLIKKLNAVKVLSKNTSPNNSRIYGSDIRYVQKLGDSKSKNKRKSRSSKRKSKSKRKSRRIKSKSKRKSARKTRRKSRRRS